MVNKISQKVAVFVIREFEKSIQLLMINHPNTDYQFPAGTIRKGENPEVAALREVSEETGLEKVKIIKKLQPHIRKYEKYARLIKKAKVYSRPSDIASKYGKLRKGLKVKIIRKKGDFTQVRYRERDNQDPDRPVMLHIKGWVKQKLLAYQEKRYFFIVKADDEQTQPWTVIADHHKFTLEWHKLSDVLNNMVKLAGPQARWFVRYKEELSSLINNS